MNKKWYLLFFLVVTASCRKDHLVSNNNNNNQSGQSNLPPGGGMPVNVTINPNQLINPVPAAFEGLSYETAILTQNPEVLNVNNKVLIQLIKNLGPGLLRIGGDTSDETFWTGGARNDGTGPDSITTSDVDRLAAFSTAIGWPVLFGLNFGSSSLATDIDESLYVSSSLKSNLYALQIGNEPDVYHLFGLRDANYGFSEYQKEFETYKNGIQSNLPSVNFAGPGIAYQTDWISEFAGSEANNVSLLDAHYYVAGPASSTSIDYHTILAPDYKLTSTLYDLSNSKSNYHLPFRITECNNIYGGGKAGASDVFASALWALDFMWQVATATGEGINFHGGDLNGANLIYSPIVDENGTVTARPEYYAMLAFKYGSSGGTIISSGNDQPNYNFSNYACLNADKTITVTLINKDTITLSVNIQMDKTVSSIEVSNLTAPSVTSTTGTVFAGSVVNADGTFTPAPKKYTINQNKFTVSVPAGSASVVTINY